MKGRFMLRNAIWKSCGSCFVSLAARESQMKINATSVTGDTSKLLFSSHIARVGGFISTKTDARVLEVSPFSQPNSDK